MSWPSSSARTKNWGTEILTDTDQEAQFDLLHNYNNDQLNGTTGHGHTGGTNDGKPISLTASVSGILPVANGGTGVATTYTPFSTGMIILWSGTIASIPSGFVLCNGANSTPDLTNRFIVCADADVGGVAKSTVTGSAAQSGEGQIPAHTHTVAISSSTASSSSGSTMVTGGTTTTSSFGTGTKNVAVFYALAYIMKT